MTNKKLTTVETERLVLRAFRESDAQDVFNACSNPVIGHNAGWPPHQTIEDSLFYINEVVPLGFIWAVTEKDNDHVIGSIGLLPDPRTPEDESTMMLGFWVAEEYWNRGYITEASKAVINWGFTEGDLGRITVNHYLFNHASRRVLEKCGFEKREIGLWESDDPNEPDEEVQWYEMFRK